MMNSEKDFRDFFNAQTRKVRAGNRGCVTPSMLAERDFVNTKVIGVVENPNKEVVVETRVSPTIIRRRLKSKVFGIAL